MKKYLFVHKAIKTVKEYGNKAYQLDYICVAEMG